MKSRELFFDFLFLFFFLKRSEAQNWKFTMELEEWESGKGGGRQDIFSKFMGATYGRFGIDFISFSSLSTEWDSFFVDVCLFQETYSTIRGLFTTTLNALIHVVT